MGGSQGAQRLNEVCPRAAGIVRRSGIPVQAIHLSGARDRDRVQDAYREEGVPCRVFSFLAEVGKAYHAADLAVARAGAATCAELCTCGVPALLVPLPAARRDHQTANARALARGGGADVMPQGRLTPEALASYIAARAQAPDGLRARAAAMRRMAVPDATERLSSLVEEIARAR
jgi:UDP-N-acetylglucosamine--N-acetylmuramyl-(pentapeptide) pyrophosphoryl-undecaprenol N-acetylglucosamine transferase